MQTQSYKIIDGAGAYREDDGRIFKDSEIGFANCGPCKCMDCRHYREQGAACAVMAEEGRARPCGMCKYSEIIIECDRYLKMKNKGTKK